MKQPGRSSWRGWHMPSILKDGDVEAFPITGRPSRGWKAQGNLLEPPTPQTKARGTEGHLAEEHTGGFQRLRVNGLGHAEFPGSSDFRAHRAQRPDPRRLRFHLLSLSRLSRLLPS